MTPEIPSISIEEHYLLLGPNYVIQQAVALLLLSLHTLQLLTE